MNDVLRCRVAEKKDEEVKMNFAGTVIRYHDFSCGHRVYKHESKCSHLHGHNYRVHFEVRGQLDSVGRIIDFSVIKDRLCEWIEDAWDHKFLLWEHDPWYSTLKELDPLGVIWVPFNPTAENMAQFLLFDIGPHQLKDTGVELMSVRIEETRKCSAQVWR